MRKKDSEQLAEIAFRANAGEEALAGKMAKRLWRVRRWAAEQTWSAAADTARREILERLGASIDGALHVLEQLKAHRDAAPAAAPETSPAAVEPAAATPAIASPAATEEPEPDEEGPLVSKSTEEKVALAVAVQKSGGEC